MEVNLALLDDNNFEYGSLQAMDLLSLGYILHIFVPRKNEYVVVKSGAFHSNKIPQTFYSPQFRIYEKAYINITVIMASVSTLCIELEFLNKYKYIYTYRKPMPAGKLIRNLIRILVTYYKQNQNQELLGEGGIEQSACRKSESLPIPRAKHHLEYFYLVSSKTLGFSVYNCRGREIFLNLVV